MRTIIFGIEGFEGQFLSELLKINNIEVIGGSRSKGDPGAVGEIDK